MDHSSSLLCVACWDSPFTERQLCSAQTTGALLCCEHDFMLGLCFMRYSRRAVYLGHGGDDHVLVIIIMQSFAILAYKS